MSETDFAEREPLILDVDASVLPVAEQETRLDLSAWQEAIRFGCSRRVFADFTNRLQPLLPKNYGCVFTGSGDFHHLSLFLLQQAAAHCAPNSLDVVVCDNHPDNMRYPFGIHCGSWVCHAAALPAVRHIHVVGITSADISAGHAWENYLGPFFSGKLTYWSLNQDVRWLRWLGLGERARSFSQPEALLDALIPCLAGSAPLYLSIDKDVLDRKAVETNWDQGIFLLSHIHTLLEACFSRLAGMDITGDVSAYTYRSPFKRLLSRLDGQRACNAEHLQKAKEAHQVVNRNLLALLRPDDFGRAAHAKLISGTLNLRPADMKALLL